MTGKKEPFLFVVTVTNFLYIFIFNMYMYIYYIGDEAYHADCFRCVQCSKKIDDLVFTQTSKVILSERNKWLHKK